MSSLETSNHLQYHQLRLAGSTILLPACVRVVLKRSAQGNKGKPWRADTYYRDLVGVSQLSRLGRHSIDYYSSWGAPKKSRPDQVCSMSRHIVHFQAQYPGSHVPPRPIPLLRYELLYQTETAFVMLETHIGTGLVCDNRVPGLKLGPASTLGFSEPG